MIEGITSQVAFNRTQRAAQNIFNESILGFQNLSLIKDEVYKFQMDYQKAMNNNIEFAIITYGLDALYLFIPEAEVETIRSEVKQSKSLAGQSLNSMNYAAFSRYLEWSGL